MQTILKTSHSVFNSRFIDQVETNDEFVQTDAKCLCFMDLLSFSK